MEDGHSEPSVALQVDASCVNHEVKIADEDASYMTPMLKKKLVAVLAKMFGMEKHMAEVVFDTAMSLRRAMYYDTAKNKKR